MTVNQNNIPEELKNLPQWVNWKKKDKCPVNPKTGRNALSNNPKSWGSFDDAFTRMEAHKGNGIGGVGFEFSEDDPYVGIDFDHCFKDGKISKEVDEILRGLDTYCEISPSGEGIHTIVKGRLPGPGLGPEKGRLCEMYDRGRYFTFTGRWLGQYGGRIESRENEILSLYEKMAGGNGTGTASNENVIDIKKGVNDGVRNVSCASVAGYYLAKGYSPADTLAHCLEWNGKNKPPLSYEEVKKTVDSMVRKDARERATIKKFENAGLDHKKIIECLSANEDGDARLFQHLFKDKYIYDHGGGLWVLWQGHYWQDDETDAAYKDIEVVVNVYKTASMVEQELTEKAEKKESKKWHQLTAKNLKKRIHKLESAARKRNVLWCATIGTGLTGREWDQNPMLFACRNGVIDLKTGTFGPGKQSDLIKTATDLDFDNAARCPKWKQFLNEAFDHDEDLIAYVRRLFGYGITGLKEEHVLPVLWGQGRNGKGTFLETIKLVMGDHAHKTRAESLLDTGKLKPSGSADADITAFRGKRLIWASETNEGGKMNVGKIKELVGGDTLNARAPFARRSIEFQPTHLLCLVTNEKPYAPASDFALWERVALIPFTMAFVDNPQKEHERQVDKKLPEELKTELPGILNWLVEGCLEWQKYGLNPPEIVKAATSKYQKENDLIGDFIEECCTVGEYAEAQSSHLYGTYKAWAEGLGHRPINGTLFGKEMKKRFEKEIRRKRAFYIGLCLNNLK